MVFPPNVSKQIFVFLVFFPYCVSHRRSLRLGLRHHSRQGPFPASKASSLISSRSCCPTSCDRMSSDVVGTAPAHATRSSSSVRPAVDAGLSPSVRTAARRRVAPKGKLFKICVTGAPGGGKSSVVASLPDAFVAIGLTCSVVPECFTSLFSNLFGGCTTAMMEGAAKVRLQRTMLRFQLQ
eukprot:SAG11_NODE_13667_length_644_cov_1.225688_1_plen_180_part_10